MSTKKAVTIRTVYEIRCGYCGIYIDTTRSERDAERLAREHRDIHQREWDREHVDTEILETLLVDPEPAVPESQPLWRRMFGVKR